MHPGACDQSRYRQAHDQRRSAYRDSEFAGGESVAAGSNPRRRNAHLNASQHSPAGRGLRPSSFDGTADLPADADVIVGGMLIDVKAGQGGKPRKDGTRAASLARHEIDQLIGYALLDYSDQHHLDTVAIYATRFRHLATWPLNELCTQLAGHPVDIADLRTQFTRILRDELPRHQAHH